MSGRTQEGASATPSLHEDSLELEKTETQDDGESELLDDEIKARLITRILELEEKTGELGQRTAEILQENVKLKSGNDVLSQYIENLLASSPLFQKIESQVGIRK